MNISIRPTSSNILFCLNLRNIILQGKATVPQINYIGCWKLITYRLHSRRFFRESMASCLNRPWNQNCFRYANINITSYLQVRSNFASVAMLNTTFIIFFSNGTRWAFSRKTHPRSAWFGHVEMHNRGNSTKSDTVLSCVWLCSYLLLSGS